MKISSKLILGYLIVASIAASATYFALQSYKNINAAFDRLMDDPVPTIKALNDLRDSANQIVALTSKDELSYDESKGTNDPAKAQALTDAERALAEASDDYQESEADYEEIIARQGEFEKRHLATLKESGDRIVDLSKEIIQLKKGENNSLALQEKEKAFDAQKTLFFQTIDDSLDHESAQVTDERENVEATITQSTRTTLLVSGLTFVLAFALGLYISRMIARRITNLKSASENVGHGKFETIIKIEADDEIGALARSFNKMVSDLETSHNDLVESKKFVNNIVSSIADSLIVLDMDLKIIRVNQALIDLTGFQETELLGHPVKVLRPDGNFFNERDFEELTAKNSLSGIETFWQTKDKRNISILFSASVMHDSNGAATGIVSVAQDITVRKSLEDQLSHQALHDSLTRLANRVLFRNRVEHALASSARTRRPVAVLFLDLDNFKTVNDTLGHEAGDTLLISVAERLVACLRPTDTVARLGGDEFAVLLESVTNVDEVKMIAERLNDVLREPFALGGKELPVHTSIGIAVSNGKGDNIEDLLRDADVAMYKAKGQGKDQAVLFENKMREDLIERIEFELDLRRAVEEKQFVLHYQPIINLHTKEITGMEALVRWQHPQHGLIPPDNFIPVAEETNLIIPLGNWVLEEACRQAKKWQLEFPDQEPLSITVNLSNKQTQEEKLVETVASALAKSNLPAGNLILEITESTMLQNTEETIKKLNELKRLGVRLAIDDFGTGYSSLSYLQRFPIDVLKIDKSFVDKINNSKEGAAVTRAIITMSETLNLKTIAEGIETNGQNMALQVLGCEYGQGYHFSRPLTKEAMSLFLKNKVLDNEVNFLPNQIQNEAADKQAYN